MSASEQALRDQIAFQLGIMFGKLVKREEFDVSDHIDPIMAAARKLTPSNPLEYPHCSKCGLLTGHASGCSQKT